MPVAVGVLVEAVGLQEEDVAAAHEADLVDREGLLARHSRARGRLVDVALGGKDSNGEHVLHPPRVDVDDAVELG